MFIAVTDDKDNIGSRYIEVPVGNESTFVELEEQVVYRLQQAWHAKTDLVDKAMIDVSAKLEDCAYQETKIHFKLNETMQLWMRPECVEYYRSLSERLIQSLVRKDDKDSKRLYGRSGDIEQLYKLLMKEDKSTKSIEPKTPKANKAVRTAKPKTDRTPKTQRKQPLTTDIDQTTTMDPLNPVTPLINDEDEFLLKDEGFDFDFSAGAV
jgi:hypothetical protein